jgi:hypothetical protein
VGLDHKLYNVDHELSSSNHVGIRAFYMYEKTIIEPLAFRFTPGP